ncbi:PfkB family carbohydrate kinase [Trinickia mobilis]|uniref:PfkB family carbohydrate kinase n=1 Tax=Trinickia mobilis TaxID=2816356 RepID=UPI001A8E5A79|nr:PfkB family carbohydrate kinase [Trinickia mobilis]
MSAITIVGGVYHERCIWPEWDFVYGSGGRAAVALSSQVERVTLQGYASAEIRRLFANEVALCGLNFVPVDVEEGISFEYVHCMSNPVIRPSLARIARGTPIRVSDEAVLRIGMLEGDAVVDAKWCVYDPQSAFNPAHFGANGSKAVHLAIVSNRREVLALTGASNAIDGARLLVEQGAEVVVVKCGPAGALVVTREGEATVPAFRSQRVWTIGSGDVFAAIFAAQWAVHRESPVVAAELASKAVASYVDTMSLPSPRAEQLRATKLEELVTRPGKVYLASPFFTLGQRWLVDEARRCLQDLGLDVFSPAHDVGTGNAEEVGPADIAALKECDRVFAILDGMDSGTIFETGYARSEDLPVYGLAQAARAEDLKMLVGTDCKIFDDFVTALHHTAWKT